MQIRIIGVGRLKEKYLRQGMEEYLKRLGAYARVEVLEVADEKEPENASEKDIAGLREKEGARILEKLREREYVILLDIGGESLDSEGLAKKMEGLSLYGNSQLAFVIGGSYGVSESVRRRADFRLSFSKMTFPHQLIRLFLLEQVYRAFKIIHNEPYHK